MTTLTCMKCNSTKMVPKVQVRDQGERSDGSLKVIIAAVPEAVFFRGSKQTHLRANICGECGFTELYADEPELIYATYLKSLEPRP